MEQNKELSGVGFLRKLSACKTAEELCSAAAAEGKKLTQQEAASLLEKLRMQSRELSDTELAAVAGGDLSDTKEYPYTTLQCLRCGKIKRIVLDNGYDRGDEILCFGCDTKHPDWVTV